MHLDKFDYILALVETQNLTRAAKMLYISQPALTVYLNKLEDELGVKLFDRTKTPVQITSAGALYVEQMKALKESSTQLVARLRQMGSTRDVLNIGIGTSRGMRWLPRLLPGFCAEHPGLSTSISQGEDDVLEREVRDRSLDVSIGVFSGIYAELEYTPLFEETMLLAVPRSFPCVSDLPLWEATPDKPYLIAGERLSGIPFLRPRTTSDFYRAITGMVEKYRFTPGVIHTHGFLDTAYRLAQAGMGAIFVTDNFLSDIPPEQASCLAYCTLCDPPIRRRISACYQRDCGRRELVEQFLETVRIEIKPNF